MNKTNPRGAAVAAAVAGLFAAGGPLGCRTSNTTDDAKRTTATTSAPAPAASTPAQVKCEGINDCKGKSACNTATSGCAGQNACKGKGWITVSEKECADKGGKVLKD